MRSTEPVIESAAALSKNACACAASCSVQRRRPCERASVIAMIRSASG